MLIIICCVWASLELYLGTTRTFKNEVPKAKIISFSRAFWLFGMPICWADTRFQFSYFHPSELLSAIILGLMLFAVVIRFLAIVQLGNNFTYDITVGDNHQLETKGIYKLIRHPSYLAICILDSIPGLITGSILGTIAMTVGTIPQTVFRLEQEEKELKTSFGADYESYGIKTAKMIPLMY